MLNDNADDKNDNDYFDNNIDANMEEYMLATTNEIVNDKDNRG